ncbi:carboxylesterase/lipase family protein [Caulobacter sp. KR2-114]|uniref:carboxylesterase/lipase family protein n=1 Tax=Caulobacter sp. KR2-114 TaxID=3400912 RepID=UPI003C0736FB
MVGRAYIRSWAGAVAAAVAISGAATAWAEASPPRAKVDGGVVVGKAQGPAAVFRSIPYAAPPIGPRRWKPPAPVIAWNGQRVADTPGPACMQTVPEGRPNGGGYMGPVSEDCLTLDVTAPVGLASAGHKAPVMVWIPGGGNLFGAANVPSYDAVNFARDGVIVVTMNYRLGALGFFAHPALTAEAPKDQGLVNYGLMDQIAVLKWVKRNIAAFGGDPGNVTLFGESAGGQDTLTLLSTPASHGLFQKAIVESGGGWEPPADLATREAQGADLATRLGLPGAKATPAQLRALPADKLMVSAGGMAEDGRLLTETPTQAFARGHALDVPLIIGSNSNEASLLGSFGLAATGDLPPDLKQVYAAEAPTDAELARVNFNDRFMGAPARWIAARASGGAPAWLYYFSYVPERQRQTRPGTNHASEIPFVFDSLDAVPGRTPQITPSERAIASAAHACWVGFAKTGAPACAGGLAWPAYDPATDQLMEFGNDGAAIRSHFRKPQLDAQEKAAAALLGAP